MRRVEFAYLAYRTNEFAASARLYFDGLRADPKLAQDMDVEAAPDGELSTQASPDN